MKKITEFSCTPREWPVYQAQLGRAHRTTYLASVVLNKEGGYNVSIYCKSKPMKARPWGDAA